MRASTINFRIVQTPKVVENIASDPMYLDSTYVLHVSSALMHSKYYRVIESSLYVLLYLHGIYASTIGSNTLEMPSIPSGSPLKTCTISATYVQVPSASILPKGNHATERSLKYLEYLRDMRAGTISSITFK